MTTVAVIDDHPVFREGLARTIASASDLQVALTADSVEDYDAKLASGRVPAPNVVVLDLGLPGMSGAVAVEHVCAQGSSVLVVSADGSEEAVVDAIGAGASGYLTKAADPYEITVAIREVGRGGTYISPTLASFLVRSHRKGAASAVWELTLREREVLVHLAEGSTDKEIAATLKIKISTVHGHLDRIRDKTGARRRAQLAKLLKP